MSQAKKQKSNGAGFAAGKTALVLQRIGTCIKDSIAPATKTAIWLLKITIPISLVVTLLQHFGVLNVVSEWLSPAFGIIGLRGEAALVFLTGVFLNIYSAIAVIANNSTSVRASDPFSIIFSLGFSSFCKSLIFILSFFSTIYITTKVVSMYIVLFKVEYE